MGRPRIDLPRLKNLTRLWESPAIELQVAEDIVSNFRIMCVAGLTALLFVLFADAAAAQSATPTDRTGKPYLAGLRPPHEPHKTAHVNAKNDQANKPASKKSQKAAAKVANKIAKPGTKHAANSTTRARGRSGTKTSRIDWPQVDPAGGEDRSVPPTALQFTADDTKLNDTKLNETSSNVTATPAPKAAAAAKASQASPPRPAGDDRNAVAPVAADQPIATSTVAQAERFEAPAQNIEQALAPQSQSNAPAIDDNAPKPRSKAGSSVAQTLVMLAGAISAALVGCWMFGFGSARRIRLGA